MTQKRIDRGNQDSTDKNLFNIDANFDDVFDVLAVLPAAYSLTSQTAAQKLLNTSPTGALSLPVGTYEFETEFELTSMSASSGGFGFALGGSATFTQAWSAIAQIGADPLSTPVAPVVSWNTAANVELATAAASKGDGWARIRGILRVTVPGTIIPQVSLTVAAVAIVSINSFFRLKKISQSATAGIIQPPSPNQSGRAWL